MARKTEEKALSKGAKRPSVETFPWERQPSESIQAFSRFLSYRDLPANQRSLRQTAKLCEISEQLCQRWSRRWSWVNRAAAYDNHLAELGDGVGKLAVLRHRSALVRLASVSLDKAQRGIAKLDETKLDVSEMNELANCGMKAGQAAWGEPDRRPSGPSVVVQTALTYGDARPSWLERSEAKANEIETERIVGTIEEKVLEGSQAGVAHTAQAKPPRGKLKQLVMSAPVRAEDP